MRNEPKIIGIVFSKDRAMQLDLCIRSLIDRCKDFSRLELRILYTTKSAEHQKQYAKLIHLYENYENISFIKEESFKNDLISIIAPFDYVLFIVDDNVFIRDFSIIDIINWLDDNPDALGFSFRLGKNTTYCYMFDKPQPLPKFEKKEKFLKYNWANAEFDFGYSLEVSSSLYRIKDIWNLLLTTTYTNPNTLESNLDSLKNKFINTQPFLLCFETSAAFCIPLNLVQSNWINRHSQKNWYTIEVLQQLFDYNYRIDLTQFSNFLPNSCHQEVFLKFERVNFKSPQVSIIIPCYNLGNYLPEAISSVIAQTFENWEIIIVNDGSTDQTKEIIQEILIKYPDKQIIGLNTPNNGAGCARNIGIAFSRGEYILPLDADDIIHPDFLQKTKAILDAHQTIDIVYTDLKEFGLRNRIIRASEFNPHLLPVQNQLNYCSLFRRKVWEEVGGYRPNLIIGPNSIIGYEDWDFWVGAVEKGFCAKRLPEPLLMYRIRSNSHYSKLVQNDIINKAQIVLNHQSLYSQSQIVWAKKVLELYPNVENIPNQIGVIPIFPDYIHKIKGRLSVEFKNYESNPLVSVIVPTYNRPNWLYRAVESIINQTYQNFEVIVVNDAGEDVQYILEKFKDNRIKYFITPENIKLAGTRNFGIFNSTGIFIAYLDDDDVFYPNHLETLVKALIDGQYKVAYTDAFYSIQSKVSQTYVTKEKEIRYSFDFDPTKFLFENYVPICCIMHRKELISELGAFDPSLTTHEDWDLWIRFSRKYPFKHIKEITCEVSWRMDGSTSSSQNRPDFMRTRKIIYNKNKNYFLSEVEKSIENGKIQEAESLVIKILSIFDPKIHPEPLIDLGVIRSLEGKTNEAISIFHEVLTLHPENEIARENYLLLTTMQQ